MSKEGDANDQLVVTWWKQGGEYSDETREFNNYNAAASFAWMKHRDPNVTRVLFKSRKLTYTPWKVHTITEPEHY